MTEDVIAKKIANYFVPTNEAAIPDMANFSIGGMIEKAIAQKSLEKYIKKNGLWIGGAVELTTTSISFEANNMNKQLNIGNTVKDTIRLKDIRILHHKKAFLSDIISIEGNDSLFVFRCFRAMKFFEMIKRQAPQHIDVGI